MNRSLLDGSNEANASRGKRGDARQAQIESAAAELFRRQSYHGTSMREIAKAVGIDVATLYNYFDSKQALLGHLIWQGNVHVLKSVVNSVEAAGPDPEDQLRAAIRGYIEYLEHNMDVASVSDTELRGLTPEHLQEVEDVKEELTETFRGILQAGAAAERFRIRDLSLDSVFILSILVRIPPWYVAGGPRSLPEITDLATDFILAALREHPND